MSGGETPDQARTRRRWITLAELVAVAGVVIAALGLWRTWADRRADEADKVAAQQVERAARSRLALVAEVQDNGRRLALRDAAHDIQQVRLVFPPALGVAAQAPAGDPVVEADWVAKPLLKLTDGGADERAGRLPVLAEVRFWDGDRVATARDVYDLVWRTEGRMLAGRRLRLEGWKLRRRGGRVGDLDRLWVRPQPGR